MPTGVEETSGKKKQTKKLKVERIFTFPNKDPYGMCCAPEEKERRIRGLVGQITDKGESLNYFTEDEAFQFEAELAYIMLYGLISENFANIRVKPFYFEGRFFSKEFFQTVMLVTTALAIINQTEFNVI